MTVQVAIQNRFAQMLAPLGDWRQTVDTALRRFAIEQITTKINELRRRDREKEYRIGLNASKRSCSTNHAFLAATL